MNIKGVSLIWSPNQDSRFIKYTSKQIEVYEFICSNNLDYCNQIHKSDTYQENDIKYISWHSSDLLAIGIANGVIRFISLNNQQNEFGLNDREIRSKHSKLSIVSWNPFTPHLLGVVIDKTKGSNLNEGSILIWEFFRINVKPSPSNPIPNQYYSNDQCQLTNINTGSSTLLSLQNASSSTITNMGTNAMLNNSTSNDTQMTLQQLQQHNYEYCKGDVVNSFCWIGEKKLICGVNNKHLKIFDFQSTNPLRITTTDSVNGLCFDRQITIASFVEDRIMLWIEDKFDKPILTNAESNYIESIEWSPWRDNFILVTYREKPFIKILDTKMAIKNPSSAVHALVDQIITTKDESVVNCAIWHQTVVDCILILTGADNFELHFVRNCTVIAISVDQHIVWLSKHKLRYTTCCNNGLGDIQNVSFAYPCIHSSPSTVAMTANTTMTTLNATMNNNNINSDSHLCLMAGQEIINKGQSNITMKAPASSNSGTMNDGDSGGNINQSNRNNDNNNRSREEEDDERHDDTIVVHYKFMEEDISQCMKKRTRLDRYGLEYVSRDSWYSTKFDENSELYLFWKWIEDPARNNNYGDIYGSRSKVSPYIGVVDCIRDVATISKQSHKSSVELLFKMKDSSAISQTEEVFWNSVFDKLPFDKYVHQYRDRIFNACGLPFHKPLDQWRYILENMDNRERSSAIALVTLNFDVALQYLKMIPNDKAINNEILRLCLAGFNTQGGGSNSHWSMICRDVLRRLGNSRPYLSLIFNFLIARTVADLDFLKTTNILLIDKIAIATLYFDDDKLMEFLTSLSKETLSKGNLEAVTICGLRNIELIDLLQCYVDMTSDIQTASIAVLQAFVLAKNSQIKTRVTLAWIESYRNLLDIWRLWFIRADFDIVNQYFQFISCQTLQLPAKSIAKSINQPNLSGVNRISGQPNFTHQISTSTSTKISNSKSVGANKIASLADQCQVYVSCHYCGWKISQPSKYAVRGSRRNQAVTPTNTNASMGVLNSQRLTVSSSSSSVTSNTTNNDISGTVTPTPSATSTRPSFTANEHQLIQQHTHSTAMHSGGCKGTICQNCRKPLPRCSVCLMHMTINSEQVLRNCGAINTVHRPWQPLINTGGVSQIDRQYNDDQLANNPVSHWFVWCQQCKHGGHSEHINSWFREWNECPVYMCRCQCASLDHNSIMLTLLC